MQSNRDVLILFHASVHLHNLDNNRSNLYCFWKTSDFGKLDGGGMIFVIKVALGVVLGVGVCALIWTHSPVQITRNSPAEITLSYVDLVSIMLTAVSIILAALGFVIAILGFVGWNSIGAKVSQSAKEFLKESVEDGGELHRLVKEEAKEIIYAGIQPVDSDFDEGGEEN